MSDTITRLNAVLEACYRIGSELGEGGMATVYLADDLKHERKVALKVLKPELAAVVGAERFLTEIKTTANLQHPHILPLFDSGEADGFLFFVMPFVEGETLRDLIDREKQLPVRHAVAIAVKVAQALDYAHRHGVVHRDIKPANILLHDGEPVVADFGIALAVQEAGGGRMTETGLSLGTPFYMSPEQATGDRVPDARSDVYSLGSVLYEMLVGEPPFQGSTAQSVLGKILTSDVTPPTEVRKSLPPHVGSVVMKALERLPADRFESAGDLAEALGDPAFRHGVLAQPAVATERAHLWRAAAIAFMATSVVLGVFALKADAPAPPPDALRLSIPVPAESPLLNTEAGSTIQISADGSTIAYLGVLGGESSLFIRGRSDIAPREVPNTTGTRMFFLSPSGDEVAFVSGADQTLRSASTTGGGLRTIVDSAGDYSGDWTDDGWIYYQNGQNGVSRVPATGGEPEVITVSPARAHTWIDVLPGGKAAFISTWGVTAALDSVGIVDLETGLVENLVQAVQGRYSRSGHFLYVTSAGTLMAAPFDLASLSVEGPAIAILEGVRSGDNAEAEFSLSDAGSLVFRVGSTSGAQQLVWVDSLGNTTWIDSTFVADIAEVALSPDGNRAAFVQVTGGRPDLWTKRVDGGDAPPQRLTFDGPVDIRRPAWSPAGDSVFFVGSDGETTVVMAVAADGTGDPVRVLESDTLLFNEVDLSPDGEWIVLRAGANPTSRDVIGFRRGDPHTPVDLVVTRFDEKAPRVSPDGRWLAYVSNQAGRTEVYVRPFPDTGGGVLRITSDGGVEPVWRPDGRAIYYKTNTRMLSLAELDFSDGISVTRRTALFDVSGWAEDVNHWSYSAHPTTGQILAIARDGVGHDSLIWVEHFFSAIRRHFAEPGGG
jgi:serine/threonine-protein kinase